ncbi:MAG: DUF4143 domain-containing protein [Gemmatimonadetes bacterium]|nr:DUF4143 domain-containing protein [Gemmatimonadota bacterium]
MSRIGYRERLVDGELETRLASSGAVVIEGPKACGKTSTARQAAASEVLLDVDERARQAIAVDPSLVLEGDVPRLIDEWQVAPTIWNHIRRAIDDRRAPGQFILTGSAVPADDITRHTGAGRLTRLRMRPMTLFESGHGTGAASIAELLRGAGHSGPDPGLSVRDLAERTSVGGWPGHLGMDTGPRLQAVRDYLEEIRRVDVGRLDGTRRDPDRVGRLMRSLARNVATETPVTTLAADAGGPAGSLHAETVRDYLVALERLMIIEDQPAWAPHLRARSILRRSPKRHYVDPSLAVAALRASPERLLEDLGLFGLFFESLVIRDLRAYAQRLDGRVYHYRDNTGLEVDAIIELADGRWAAFEVKLGAGHVDHGARTLERFADRVDTERRGLPAALVVVSGTGYAHVRDDGINVIPVGALGP